MLIGGMVWAYILGSFCGIITQMDSRGTSFRNTMDDLNFMLEDQQIPQEARRRVRQYVTTGCAAVATYDCARVLPRRGSHGCWCAARRHCCTTHRSPEN